MNNEAQILEDSIFKIGKVISVDGRIVRVKVDKVKNTSHLLYRGTLLKNVSVGGYIKIIKGFTKIVCKVDGEYTTEDKNFSDKTNYTNDKQKINRILNVSLLGFFNEEAFERGIKEMPLVDNECFLLNDNEFDNVHDFIGKKGDIPLTIGSLALENGQKINIGVNSLFASHIGIFGNTGSGKSYTLAKIYRELFEIFREKEKFHKNAHFILFDFNGEYSNEKCITENKKVYNLSTKEIEENDEREKFPLSEEDLISLELVSILADATDKTQKPFISRSLNFYKKVHSAEEPLEYFKNTLKKRIADILKMSDKNKAYSLLDYIKIILPEKLDDAGFQEDLTDDIDWHNSSQGFRFVGNNDTFFSQHPPQILNTKIYSQANEYTFPNDIISKIIHFLYLQLIYDVYTDKAQNEHIAPAINKLRSKKSDIEKVLDTQNREKNIFAESNLIVINLYDVNLEMKKTLPLLFSRKVYNEHKIKRKNSTKESLNIIIDEAHNILSKESVRETESWKDYRLETFEEIIKEGRKFGIFLTIASQRPSDISSTIISQLHNYFLHRLINNNDIIAIERTISYLDKLSVEALSILPTGTCVLAGMLAQIPVVVDIGRIEPEDYEPDNKTPKLIENWQ